MTASNRFLATPSDFYAPFSVAVISANTYHYLDFKHTSFIKEFAPNTTVTGRPRYYSLFDETAFELSPVPDSTFTAELHYLFKPASLTAGSDSGTTFLSTDHPDPLLYGTLVEAAVFLKEISPVSLPISSSYISSVSRP